MNAPILLVDAYSQIYRAYYAVRELTDAKGRPSNAVFAFSRFLLKLDKEFSGERGAFVADKDKCAFRLEIAPGYKANRAPMPDDLKAQTPAIFELVNAFGWNNIELSGLEADDLIAAIAADVSDAEIRIITPDKDMSQIVTERVKLLVPDRTGSAFECRGPAEIQQKFDVAPGQIVDYLALIGDTSDNVPGIVGVGPKTAANLLKQFGSIPSMMERTAEIKNDKIREKVAEAGELLKKNIQLITLKTDIPEQPWLPSSERLKRRTPDWKRISEIAADYNLRSVVREIEETRNAIVPPPPQKDQMELF
jgi:DNA polymerase-1